MKNVEVIKSFIDAWNRHDLDAAYELRCQCIQLTFGWSRANAALIAPSYLHRLETLREES